MWFKDKKIYPKNVEINNLSYICHTTNMNEHNSMNRYSIKWQDQPQWIYTSFGQTYIRLNITASHYNDKMYFPIYFPINCATPTINKSKRNGIFESTVFTLNLSYRHTSGFIDIWTYSSQPLTYLTIMQNFKPTLCNDM